MFFAIILLVIWICLATGLGIDQFGWMMFIGAAWLAGYLDNRLFHRSDKENFRTVPYDVTREKTSESDHNPIPDDRELFSH